MASFTFPKNIYEPDAEDLLAVLSAKKEMSRLHNIEVIIDEEIKKEIICKVFHEKYYNILGLYEVHKKDMSYQDYMQAKRDYYKMQIDFHKKVGYSIVADHDFLINLDGYNGVFKAAKDTAIIARENRLWAQEGFGIINSWEDFENFPWDKTEELLAQYEEHLDYVEKILPDNMKIAVVGAVNANILDWMLGFEGLFYNVYDNFDLVKALYDKVGELIYKMYEMVLEKNCVEIIWHGDDLGFKTSTMLSLEHLGKLLFPWLKKYADLAHKKKKLFWVHCCGYKDALMDFFIKELQIDALHSFEDGCCPVQRYKEEYGNYLALLGGVDINKLTSLDKDQLKDYIYKILETCTKGGRFALGSGNSITNYTPMQNYMTLLEIGNAWAI